MRRFVTLKNDEVVALRPVCPDDEPALREFHRRLSDRSVYQRYFHMLGLAYRTAHARLATVCAPDRTRETVLVLVQDERPPDVSIVGVGRLTCLDRRTDAEFAVIVADDWQGVGAGTALLRALIGDAHQRGVRRLQADLLRDNVDMTRVCRACGFTVGPGPEPGLLRADLVIQA